MSPFEQLWRSRKFWLAVVAVVQTVVFSLVPDFPDAVWQAINVILLWLIGTIAVEDAVGKLRVTRRSDECCVTSDELQSTPLNSSLVSRNS